MGSHKKKSTTKVSVPAIWVLFLFCFINLKQGSIIFEEEGQVKRCLHQTGLQKVTSYGAFSRLMIDVRGTNPGQMVLDCI